VDDGMAVEFIHGSHDAVLELLFGCDADMAQHRACQLGEEALDEVEPEPCLGVKVNSNRPVGRVASQVLVSFETCAE
jgi:hypothetical protein